MNDDWMQDTTDVLHCSMPPQVRAHIEELRDEIERLKAREVPLSANVGFVPVVPCHACGDAGETLVVGDGYANTHTYPTTVEAQAAMDEGGFEGTVVALIPVTAWDRT